MLSSYAMYFTIIVIWIQSSKHIGRPLTQKCFLHVSYSLKNEVQVAALYILDFPRGRWFPVTDDFSNVGQ
jgi:hypothetical protein